LRRLSDIVDQLVDDHVGIIRDVSHVPREPGAPAFFHVAAKACNTGAFCRQHNFSIAGGASAKRERAMAKAIGEAVERYCSAIYEKEEFPLTSYMDAHFPCVTPKTFALYTQEQYGQQGFRYAPFEEDTPIRWVLAEDPLSGETRSVPAAMVYLPYSYDQKEGEIPIVQPISTGLACHGNKALSTISAICEVIERDAFTITWQAQLGMPYILIDTLSDSNRDLVTRFERVGGSVTLLNITSDVGVPTILSVLRSHAHDAPALVFAAAADMNPEEAVRKSLEELAHTRRLAQLLKVSLPPLLPDHQYETIANQDCHVRLYCDHRHTALTDFLFASDRRMAFDEVENCTIGDSSQDLIILLKKIKAIGHQALIKDLTTPDISELGLCVIRALIPGFHPLYMGHKYRALGGFRVSQVPSKLGYPRITNTTGDNPAPHPFP